MVDSRRAPKRQQTADGQDNFWEGDRACLPVAVDDGEDEDGGEEAASRDEHERAAPGGQGDAVRPPQVGRPHAQRHKGRKLQQLRHAVHHVQQLHYLPKTGAAFQI